MKQNIGKILAVVLIIALCTVFFAACVPSDYSKAEANLKENGYSAVVVENGSLVNAANIAAVAFAATYNVELTGKCNQSVTGSNGEEGVQIFYFDNSKDATNLKKAVKAEIKKSKEELKTQKDNGKITEAEYNEAMEDAKNINYGSMGKTFWFGTKAGVKAAN